MNINSRKFRLLQDRDLRNDFVAKQLKTFLRNQLRALRDARNMTQKELADLIGTKQSVISRLEKNVDRVSVPTMLDIARALDVVFVARFEAIDTVIDFYENPTSKKMTPRRSEEVLNATEIVQRDAVVTSDSVLAKRPARAKSRPGKHVEAVQMELFKDATPTLKTTPIPNTPKLDLGSVIELKNVDVIEAADQAMYVAKNQSRNSVFVAKMLKGASSA